MAYPKNVFCIQPQDYNDFYVGAKKLDFADKINKFLSIFDVFGGMKCVGLGYEI